MKLSNALVRTVREQRYSNWRELAQIKDLYRSVVQAFLQTVG